MKDNNDEDGWGSVVYTVGFVFFCVWFIYELGRLTDYPLNHWVR